MAVAWTAPFTHSPRQQYTLQLMVGDGLCWQSACSIPNVAVVLLAVVGAACHAGVSCGLLGWLQHNHHVLGAGCSIMQCSDCSDLTAFGGAVQSKSE
jgi:hypothetical protein